MIFLRVRGFGPEGLALRAMAHIRSELIGGDYSAMLARIGERQAAEMALNIYESRTPRGTPYKELKRVRQGKTPRPKGHNQDPRPLLDEHNMVNSIHADPPTPRSILVGASDWKTLFHDSANRPRTKIPRRQFIGLRPEARTWMLQEVREEVLTKLRGMR